MKQTLLLFLLYTSVFLLSGHTKHPKTLEMSDLQMEIAQEDQSINIIISGGEPPYLIQVFSTSMEMKEYKGEKSIALEGLASGTYIIICQDQTNEFIQKTIEL